MVSYGAKTFPEGGFYSVPQLVADGVIIVGDAAGLTNAKKRKGLRYAIKSGIAAGEAIYQAIEKQDFSGPISDEISRSIEREFRDERAECISQLPADLFQNRKIRLLFRCTFILFPIMGTR